MVISDAFERVVFHHVSNKYQATVFTRHGSECLAADNSIPPYELNVFSFALTTFNDVIYACGGQGGLVPIGKVFIGQ